MKLSPAILARAGITAKRKATPMVDGYRSRLEKAYAEHLDKLNYAGVVRYWRYEPIRICVANGTRRAFYTPDFLVCMWDGSIEIVEIKGFWREAARLRLKVAAGLLPSLRFVAITRGRDGGWEREEF